MDARRFPGVLLAVALLAAGCTTFGDATRAAVTDDVGVERRSMGFVSDRDAALAGSTSQDLAAIPIAGALFAKRTRDAESATPRLATPDREMIYSGAIRVRVARIDAAIERLLAEVATFAGYLAKREDATLTVRVPAAHFETFMASVRGYGRVLQEKMQAAEVTKQHRDLTIRLDNARKSRARLLALLEKADQVADILKIEEQMRRLTDEIERMEGELAYLDDQIAMSTVVVSFVAATSGPQGRREPSRFPWINLVGAEYVRAHF